MSYWVYVGDSDTNHTSNTREMMAEVLGRSLREFDGAPSSEAAGVLASGARRLRENPERYRHLQPDNGWGSVESTAEFLDGASELCSRQRGSTIRVIS